MCCLAVRHRPPIQESKDLVEFPEKVAIQLNDTHPTLAIIELQRILIDMEGLEWDEAWSIVQSTFSYTPTTPFCPRPGEVVRSVDAELTPRHLQIIYEINLQFLQHVEKTFPKDRDMLSRVSIIEESHPKMVRMAYLAIIGSHKVNGVAELHSDLIKTTIFKDFVKIYGPTSSLMSPTASLLEDGCTKQIPSSAN